MRVPERLVAVPGHEVEAFALVAEPREPQDRPHSLDLLGGKRPDLPAPGVRHGSA